MIVNPSLTPPISEAIARAFEAQFGAPPTWIVRAPGRINLIGEHTDYNKGLVLPMAIDRATWIALRRRPDDQVRLHSMDFHEELTFDLARIEHGGPSWGEYARGVAWALQKSGLTLRGWDGVALCDVPMGAGLSSSASFELAIARAFQVAADFEWSPKTAARLCQQAENEWVGVNCGIMDQLISSLGRARHAMLIDCRDYVMELVPIPSDTAFVVMDTGTRRELTGSAYNERRVECELAVRHFRADSLRDVSMEELLANPPPGRVARRARHVITEIIRTRRATDALRAGDTRLFGSLMDESHASLRDDFEVSSDALDAMVSLARGLPGCLGARMTGAGFGGCAIALVEAIHAADFVKEIGVRYDRAAGRESKISLCAPSNGAEVISTNPQIPTPP